MAISSYTTIRRDRRDGRPDGGVLCCILHCIPVQHWKELDEHDLETCWFPIRPQRMPRDFPCLTIGVVYHPSGSKDKPKVDHSVKCVDFIRQRHPNSGVMLRGDFNRLKNAYLKEKLSAGAGCDIPHTPRCDPRQGVHQYVGVLCGRPGSLSSRQIGPQSCGLQPMGTHTEPVLLPGSQEGHPSSQQRTLPASTS